MHVRGVARDAVALLLLAEKPLALFVAEIGVIVVVFDNAAEGDEIEQLVPPPPPPGVVETTIEHRRGSKLDESVGEAVRLRIHAARRGEELMGALSPHPHSDKLAVVL